MEELEFEDEVDYEDIYLSKPVTHIDIEVKSTDSLRYTCTAMQGWRKTMEDASITVQLPNGEFLFGVLDGHGGPEVAKVVSRKFPLILQSNPHYRKREYQKALQEAFSEMDQWLVEPQGLKELAEQRFGAGINEIMETIKKQRKKQAPAKVVALISRTIVEESGCTANIVLVTEKEVYCANIGDSRAACIQNNRPVVMSFDHKPTDIKERRRIWNAGGFVMEGRVCGALSLSRAFGDYQYKGEQAMVIAVPDIMVFPRNELKMIFMACDGIWEGCQSDCGEGIVEQLYQELKKSDGRSCLKKLMKRMLASRITDETMWGLDNMSCILIELEGSQKKQKQKQGVQKRSRKITKRK